MREGGDGCRAAFPNTSKSSTESRVSDSIVGAKYRLGLCRYVDSYGRFTDLFLRTSMGEANDS
jgi:hypothetical protein